MAAVQTARERWEMKLESLMGVFLNGGATGFGAGPFYMGVGGASLHMQGCRKFSLPGPCLLNAKLSPWYL